MGRRTWTTRGQRFTTNGNQVHFLDGANSCLIDAHIAHQCPALHGDPDSGVTPEEAARFRVYSDTGRMPKPNQNRTQWRRQCWNVVSVPGELCWRHRGDQ